MSGAAAGAGDGATGRDPAPVVLGPVPRVESGDRVVLYGIGNDLRGDDGAGPRVARALEGAFAMTRRGGTTISAGLTNPKAVLNISPLTLVAEERTLRGSYLGSGVPARDIPRFLGLHRRGRLPVEKLMTHRIALDDVNEGFDRLHAGEAIRQVIEFDT